MHIELFCNEREMQTLLIEMNKTCCFYQERRNSNSFCDGFIKEIEVSVQYLVTFIYGSENNGYANFRVRDLIKNVIEDV